MSNPNITLAIASEQNITDPPARISEWYTSQSEGCNSFWREAALLVPSVLLVLYLGFQARRNVKKLRHRKSYVMIAYYALLWLSALLNLVWAALQGWECAPEKATAWNLLSLLTECGMLTLEISIVAFLLQENYADGLEALAHTFFVSGSSVVVDVLIQSTATYYSFTTQNGGISCHVSAKLYNLVVICRHSLYLPFLYVTFLADFFQEEDWLLDNAYYSEMKDAGFFDTEWD
ncbi:hypothetical protein SASPL_151496 [Salvia splendens]|uniref:Uncharacterized protein n=1 Tax=Salvia splendens TaxID=180675 RepID=A0A8X8W8S2_SALSN|nr:hypothetical protein SASPL_151496 [Salvia splendens]